MSEFTNYDSRCVCDICSCGGHSCPAHRFPDVQTGQSVFKTDYCKFQPNKNHPFKDRSQYVKRPYDNNYLRSTYKNDFDRKNVNNPKWKRQNGPVITNAPFYADTEYNHSFIPHESGHRGRPMTAQTKPISVPFTNKSTYNQDFKNFNRGRPQKNGPNSNQRYNLPIGLDASTTYNNDFIKKPIEPSKRLDKKEGPSTTNQPFNGDTIYNQSYQRFRVNDNVCDITKMPKRPQFTHSGQNHLYYSAKEKRWK